MYTSNGVVDDMDINGSQRSIYKLRSWERSLDLLACFQAFQTETSQILRSMLISAFSMFIMVWKLNFSFFQGWVYYWQTSELFSMRYSGFWGPDGELFMNLVGFLSVMPLKRLGLMSFLEGSSFKGSYQVYQGYYQSLTYAILFLLAYTGQSGYQLTTGFSFDLASNLPLFRLNTGVGLGLLLTATLSVDYSNSCPSLALLLSDAKFGASLSPLRILFFLNPSDGLCTDPGSCYLSSSIFLIASYMLVLGLLSMLILSLPVGGRCIMFQGQYFFSYFNQGSCGFYFLSLPIYCQRGTYVGEGFLHCWVIRDWHENGFKISF